MTTIVRLRAEGERGAGKSTLLRLLVGLLKGSSLVSAEYVSEHFLEVALPDNLSDKILERAEAEQRNESRRSAQINELNDLVLASQSDAASLREREKDLLARLDRASLALGIAAEIFARAGMDDLASFFVATKYRDCDGAGAAGCACHEAETEIPL